MLGVAIENQSAIQCYERCGFVKVGTRPKAILHDGRFIDEYIMARSAGESTEPKVNILARKKGFLEAATKEEKCPSNSS